MNILILFGKLRMIFDFINTVETTVESFFQPYLVFIVNFETVFRSLQQDIKGILVR